MVLPMPRPTSRPDSRFLQARKIIPAELRPILGRREFKRPLRAICPAEVKRLHLEAMAEWEAQLAAARAKLRGDLRTLTAREVDAFCGRWYADEAAKYADDPGSAAEWDQHLSHYAGYFHSAPGEDSEFIKDRALSDEAGAWLTAQGIAADTPSLLRFARRWAETQIRFARAMLRRVEGDWSEDPNLAAFPPPIPAPQSAPAAAPEPAPTPSLTFAALLQAWAVEAQTAPKTRAKWETAFANLASVVGHDDATRLTVADVRTWKAARFTEGRSAKTVSDGVTGLRGVVGWGIRNGLLSGPNPFEGKVSKRGPAAREGFTDEEAAKLLRVAREETGWRRWVPWLLAFSGARIGEIADMRRKDVRREGGVWVLDVVPSAVNALKTAASQRMIPLHPALEAEGFLAYVAGLPADGPLWPDLSPNAAGSRADLAGVRHGEWVREVVGITEARKAPAHSWRHRMEDQLRMARVPPEAQDAIMGHVNPRNAGAGYGRGFREMPGELLKEIGKVPSPLAPE